MEKKMELGDRLGVKVVQQHSKYLGLPTLIGKSKKRVFAGLVDRVVQKMKDWKDKMLSQSGKEVLIKAVIQAIPSYSMNCFLLPLTTCQEIEKATARFFWGATNEERKHHWAAWDVLTKTKADGGLGFREIYFFNLAMLAKQLWNLMQHPQSLSYRILKAKYFPRTAILQAGLGYKPSYLWRSLLASKELIEEGLGWRIGDGRSVCLAQDRWVGVENIQKPVMAENVNMGEEKVDLLIDEHTRRWRRDVIQVKFNGETAEKILRMPLSFRRPPDRMIWVYTKHGFYTVRSAYHVAVEKFSRIHDKRPTSSITPKEWKQMWQIKAIPRVRNFLWRACTNSLPTRVNLCKRGSKIDSLCLMCGEEQETIDHILLHCKAVFPVWYGGMLRIDSKREIGMSFRDLLWQKMNEYPPDYIELMVYTAWSIWHYRNLVYFENKPFETLDINARAWSHWKEYADKEDCVREKVGRRMETISWKLPPEGRTKLNCDVAVLHEGRAGLGFVLRNATGSVLLAGKTECEAAGSSTLLESLAIKYALQMMEQYNLQVDSVESDSKTCIEGLKGRFQVDTYCEVILQDIWDIAGKVRCKCFEFIPRQANKAAHYAAKGPEFISIRHNPTHLLEILNADIHVLA